MYYPYDDTHTFLYLDPVFQYPVDTNYNYWKYWAHWGAVGPKGDKGDAGNSLRWVELFAGFLTGVASGAFLSFCNSIVDAFMELFGLKNRPELTDSQRIQALARLISQMQDEIGVLQAQMSTVQGKVTTLQEEVGVLQTEMTEQQAITEFLSVGKDLYQYFPETYTKVNSALLIGTDSLFDKAPSIHTDGNIQCTKITPNVNNQLVINGSLYVKGYIYTTNANTGGFAVNGGIWEW